MYIYLDESGNLSKNNGQYFIVSSYTVGNPQRIVNAFRRFQRIKFPRKLKHQSEVKFNNPSIDDKLRFKTIKHLDQRLLKGVTHTEFNDHLKAGLLPKLPAKANLQIQAINSANSPEIQVADWVCGVLARYHENKPLGEEFYKALKNNIIASKELFERYWKEKWNKSQ